MFNILYLYTFKNLLNVYYILINQRKSIDKIQINRLTFYKNITMNFNNNDNITKIY